MHDREKTKRAQAERQTQKYMETLGLGQSHWVHGYGLVVKECNV